MNFATLRFDINKWPEMFVIFHAVGGSDASEGRGGD